MELEQKLQSYLINIASYFKKSKSHSIGIDLGGNNLKIVELEKKKGKIRLKNYALVKMEKNLSREDLRIFSGRIVSKILNEMDIKKKEVNIAIPSHSSLITLIEISAQTEEEIKNEIEYEAAKYIPVNLSEVIFDWQIINSDLIVYKKTKIIKNEDIAAEAVPKEDDSKPKRVLLTSVMKNISNSFQESFNSNGLLVDSIEVDCFSTQRALISDQEKNYLILDIGGEITNVIGIYKGQLLFNRNIDLAGDRITDLIAESLNVSRDRAEKMKIDQGFRSDAKAIIDNILKPVFDSIIDQAQKNLIEFDEFKKDGIDKVILSGGTSELKGIREYIQSKMKTEVVFGNPWAKIDFPKEIEKKILSFSPFFSVAVGLALIGMEE